MSFSSADHDGWILAMITAAFETSRACMPFLLLGPDPPDAPYSMTALIRLKTNLYTLFTT